MMLTVEILVLEGKALKKTTISKKKQDDHRDLLLTGRISAVSL
jgi:hypothetical protein